MRPLWLSLGWLSVGAGLAGIALPLVPTTPFLLLAAFAFAKSSPRFHAWLTEHPRLGPPIEAWRRHGVVSSKAKAAALLALAAALALSVVLGMPRWVVALQALACIAVAVFLLTRPGRPR